MIALTTELNRIAKVAIGWAPDALILAGAAGLAYGAWLVYAPAGFIVGGLLSMVAGVLASRSAA